MAYWLFKEEPSCYSFEQLARDGKTTWEGVKNPVALKNLKACKAGDLVFFYQTGKEKSVVGIMEVVKAADPEADAVSVVVKPKAKLAHPVPLSVLKAQPEFAESPLVRISRLSVVPITATQWKLVDKLGRKPLS